MLTVKEASDLIRRKDVSPVDLTQACLARIDRYNKAINAFITVTRDQALASAREMETEMRRGKLRGPLHGIPIALKDNIDTAGILTTAASGVFKDRVPGEDAEVVVRLKKAGAILLGKLNLHEFALGGTSSVTFYGPVHNPWALDRVPGGSSGGSGAAIAADLCIGTLGTDTGGSIRIPASLCGIVGFKPTYGRVSNRGVVPMSWTLDHVGPMCKTVEDAALMLGAIAGFDPLDPISVDAPVPDYSRAIGAPTTRLRVGVARTPFFQNLDPEVAKAVEAAIDVLRKLTAGVMDVQIPEAGNVADIWNSEIYAYHEPWITKTPQLYQQATRTLIEGAGADERADLRRGAPARGCRSSRDQKGVRDRRRADHADAAWRRSADCGGAGGSACSRWWSAAGRRWSRRSGQHRRVRHLWAADDLCSVRVLCVRFAHWSANQRQSLRGIDRTVGRARVRAGDRVAQAAPEPVVIAHGLSAEV
jgi:aspartyl-tRNA(Asn)/glutamyl-tRNA(Gln) amidotransferase subunit A